MSQAEEIDRTRAIFDQGLQGSLGAVVGEIAEEGIASAERKKSEGDACVCSGVGKDAVKKFVSGAVAADGDEAAVALIVGLASELRGMTGSGGGDDVNVQTMFAQARDRGAS